jgi:hypothetical protein
VEPWTLDKCEEEILLTVNCEPLFKRGQTAAGNWLLTAKVLPTFHGSSLDRRLAVNNEKFSNPEPDDNQESRVYGFTDSYRKVNEKSKS